MSPSVWVVIGPEDMPPTGTGLSLLAEGRRLAVSSGEVTAVLVGTASDAEHLGAQGADKVLWLDRGAGGADPAGAADAFALRLGQDRPEACLLTASPWGSEVAGRLCARVGAALLPGCVAIGRDSAGAIVGTRPVYGSRLVARVAAPGSSLQIITVRPGSDSPAPAATHAPVTIERIVSSTSPDWIQHLGEERVPPEALDLAEAEVVVAGGLGVGSREGFALVEELARILGGAVGATRMAVDAGWVPFLRQIGLTGRIISPRLYVACGISGSPHHMDGVRQAQLIVAINTDRHAPIFTYADVGILGDVREVLPPLIAGARRLRGEGGHAADLFGQGTEKADRPDTRR